MIGPVKELKYAIQLNGLERVNMKGMQSDGMSIQLPTNQKAPTTGIFNKAAINALVQSGALCVEDDHPLYYELIRIFQNQS